MNLIDSTVREIISKREFNSTEEWNLDSDDILYNIDYIEYECITEDMGGKQREILLYEKDSCPDVKVSYRFVH